MTVPNLMAVALEVTEVEVVLETLTPPFGHMITLFLRGTQPASPVTLTATLSIDLVTRDN